MPRFLCTALELLHVRMDCAPAAENRFSLVFSTAPRFELNAIFQLTRFSSARFDTDNVL